MGLVEQQIKDSLNHTTIIAELLTKKGKTTETTVTTK